MNDYMALLGEGFNQHVSTREKRPGVTKLIAPLFHEDGDMLDIFLEELGDNRVRVSDKGLSLMRLSYFYDIDTPNKERIFRQILNENKVDEEEGNIYLDVDKQNIYPAVLHFGQTVAKVANMSLYRREVISNLFYEQLNDEILEKFSRYNPVADYCPLKEREDLVVDYALTNTRTPIYLFGVKDRDSAKLRLSALSCVQFQVSELPFSSVVVHQDFNTQTKRDQSILTNAVDKQFTNFSDFSSRGLQTIERLAA